MMSAALLSAPSLPTLTNKKPNDTERGHRIQPPRTYRKLRNESCGNDQR